MCYTLTQKEYKRLKTRLTKAVNSKDDDKIIKECNYALNIFNEKGYPDSWANWTRAKDDALIRKQLNAPVKF